MKNKKRISLLEYQIRFLKMRMLILEARIKPEQQLDLTGLDVTKATDISGMGSKLMHD
jgi:hypothetical protein